jgi:hypothetical protein
MLAPDIASFVARRYDRWWAHPLFPPTPELPQHGPQQGEIPQQAARLHSH